MKTYLPALASIGVVALALAGCANNDPIPDSKDDIVKENEVRYLRISISNPPSTRTATFEDGTDEENAVKSFHFKFYDASGNPITDADQQTLEIDDNGNIPFEDAATANGSVGKIKTVVLQLNLTKGKPRPAYVMAFINPVNFGEITANSSMQDLRNQTREGFKSPEGSFAMNNSVFYGNDPISGANMVKMTGTPILATQLYASKEAAEAEGASSIDIYVERYAAKVRFTLAENAVDPYTVGDGQYVITFVPEAWTVNADVDKMYASKRFNDSDSETQTIPTYNQVQNMLGTWTTWNDNELHRSYWACSPSYYATSFPQVSDEIIDKVEGGTGAGEVISPYALRYYSYNQITDPTRNSPGLGVTATSDAGQNWKYVMENTMGAGAFLSANPKAAAPSVVIVGHYEVTNNNNKQIINSVNGFCIYNNKLHFRDNIPEGAIETAITIKQALMDANQLLATDQNGTLMKKNASEAIQNCFEVVHPSKGVRNGQMVPHRFVTLQLKKNLTDAQLMGLYFKPVGSDTWVQITAANIETINRLLWAQLGNAEAFTNNKAYFSIPIQHLGIRENPVADAANPPIDENGSINWKNVRVGDFGLVRNHVYSLKVSKIMGRGSGIEDLDNPLVPSMDQDNYWVKYKVNILNWRVVPAQENIILK